MSQSVTWSAERLLREAVRGILREAAGPEKIGTLIDRLVWMNDELERLGSLRRVGLWFETLGGEIEVGFAMAEPGGDLVSPALGRTRARAEVKSEMLPELDRLLDDVPDGSMSSREAYDEGPDGPCLGAYIVQTTQPTTQGWGPLLYDVSMELATQLGGGLAPDRARVSRSAAAVWGVYDSSRPDVQKAQLDINLSGWPEDAPRPAQLTPDDPTDDCRQAQAWEEAGEGWHRLPLSRAYRKAPEAVNRLRRLGLLWEAE
jgi:hypothetical protein